MPAPLERVFTRAVALGGCGIEHALDAGAHADGSFGDLVPDRFQNFEGVAGLDLIDAERQQRQAVLFDRPSPLLTVLGVSESALDVFEHLVQHGGERRGFSAAPPLFQWIATGAKVRPHFRRQLASRHQRHIMCAAEPQLGSPALPDLDEGPGLCAARADPEVKPLAIRKDALRLQRYDGPCRKPIGPPCHVGFLSLFVLRSKSTRP